MRLPFVLISALAFGIAAANATEPLRNGAYASLTTTNAAACARACADDGICMAWSFRAESACDLSAVVPASAPEGALASGISSRAPVFALRQTTPPPAPMIEAAPAQNNAETPEAVDPLAETDAELVLLGGPEEDHLRLRLSARR